MAELDPDEHTARDGHRGGASGRLIGLLLIGLGVAWFLSEIGGLSGETVRAALLTLLGAALIYTARRGRGGGRSLWPIILGVILTFSLLANARGRFRAIGAVPLPQVIEPPVVLLEPDYQGGVKAMIFNLSQMQSADLNRTITIHETVARVQVSVPPGVDVVVNSSAEVGRLLLCGHRVEGFDPSQTYESGPRDARAHLQLMLNGGADVVTVTGCANEQATLTTPAPPMTPAPPTPPSTA